MVIIFLRDIIGIISFFIRLMISFLIQVNEMEIKTIFLMKIIINGILCGNFDDLEIEKLL